MTTSRRRFLSGSAACLGLASCSVPGVAFAAGGLSERQIPGANRDFKVLEIFFAGALSHRETLWVEQPDERPTVRALHLVDPHNNPILAPPDAPSSWLDALPVSDAFASESYRVGTAGSRAIHLGLCGAALARNDGIGTLLPQMRVIATGHGTAEHSDAQEYMLLGEDASQSSSRAAGVGPAISRHTGLPSFSFYTSELSRSRNVAQRSAAVGRHGSSYTPFVIPVDQPDLVSDLAVARNAGRDSLLAEYGDRYAQRLRFARDGVPASGLRARSIALERYLASVDSMFSGPHLAEMLGELASSDANTWWDNPTRRAIRTSVALLGTGQSAYCLVSDAGVRATGTAGSHYDQHSDGNRTEHAAHVTGNVLNVLHTIREEVEAGRLDLSDTLVVLNTEFGRTFDGADAGSDHCPRGFAVAMLGGPIAPGRGGVVGDLPFTAADDGNLPNEDGDYFEQSQPATATGGLGPGPVSSTDLRAAVLLAAGIHPIQGDCFELGELNVENSSQDQACDRLATHIFGV